ncbi:NAD(P)-dependent oxidoreductase [Opitutales bacterium]|nr:NAD(P)-dependent oxidoreductase [Opitutales bacterium]
MTNILITGVTGLIGTHLVDDLQKLGHNLFGVTRSGSVSGNYEDVKIDLSTNWNISALPSNIDVIFHLAQSDKFRDFPSGAPDMFQVNVNSTAKLLDYARKSGVGKFVYSSSGGIYGTGSKPFHENAPTVPVGELGYYLGSKACSEILAQSYSTEFQVLTVRPFFIYGQTQDRSMLITRLFDNVLVGKPILLSGENGIRINPIHVNDAVKVLTSTLTLKCKESRTYNMGGPEILSIREICDLFGTYLGKLPKYEITVGVSDDLVGDIALISKELHHPNIRLSDILSELEINSPYLK